MAIFNSYVSLPEGTILLLSHSIHSIHSIHIRREGKIVDRLRRRAPDAGRCHFEMVQLHEEGMEHLKAADSWGRWKMMDNPRTWDFHGKINYQWGIFHCHVWAYGLKTVQAF